MALSTLFAMWLMLTPACQHIDIALASGNIPDGVVSYLMTEHPLLGSCGLCSAAVLQMK